eukprot:4430531-Lingulodinium_polyedra.AAC.1
MSSVAGRARVARVAAHRNSRVFGSGRRGGTSVGHPLARAGDRTGRATRVAARACHCRLFVAGCRLTAT